MLFAKYNNIREYATNVQHKFKGKMQTQKNNKIEINGTNMHPHDMMLWAIYIFCLFGMLLTSLISGIVLVASPAYECPINSYLLDKTTLCVTNPVEVDMEWCLFCNRECPLKSYRIAYTNKCAKTPETFNATMIERGKITEYTFTLSTVSWFVLIASVVYVSARAKQKEDEEQLKREVYECEKVDL
jgi:hypothetical protein